MALIDFIQKVAYTLGGLITLLVVGYVTVFVPPMQWLPSMIAKAEQNITTIKEDLHQKE